MKFDLIKTVIFAFLFTVPFTSCSDDDSATPAEPQTIAEIAAGDTQFSILVDALERVDLVNVLDGTGTFTVFAPTNAAFQASGIDLGTLTDEQLTNVLLYHVLGAEITSSAIAEGQTYASTTSASGPNGTQLSILIEKSGTAVKINNVANVTTANVDASNGVIHIVDQVILPLDLVGHAAANSNFTSLVATLGVASGDLVNVLSGTGPFTVFAPVNSAFDAIATVTTGLDADQLAKVLTYHVAAGNVESKDLSDGMMVPTVNTESFTVNIDNGTVTLTDTNGGVSTVVLTDVQCTNGIIHVLDQVIIPSNL